MNQKIKKENKKFRIPVKDQTDADLIDCIKKIMEGMKTIDHKASNAIQPKK